jgi:glucokinase
MRKLAVAVDIGGTNIKAGIVSNDGEMVRFQKVPTQARKGFGYTFILLQEIIGKLLDQAAELGDVCGVGCASAGQIDHINGKVVFATDNIPGLSGFEMKKELEAAFGLPVLVENDVNAVALGEHWLGAARDFTDFICITLGTGIGGAIFKNGKIDHGATSSAGEFGHFSIKYDGILCNCGNRGCFEQYGSVTALINQFIQRVKNGASTSVTENIQGDLTKITGELIFEAQKNGDRLAAETIGEYLSYLSIGIVDLVHILNPSAVVIGGGITRIGDPLIGPLRDSIFQRAMPNFVKKLTVVKARLGDQAGLFGAVKDLFGNE